MLYIGDHVRGLHDLVDVPGAVKVSPARQKRGIGSSKRNLVPSAVAISGHKVSDVFSDRFTMFVGAAPKEFISQILDVVPFPEWNAAYVCCSSSFRPEVALKQRYPNLRIVGNDVSLLSVAIGELAVGRSLEFRFKNRLGPIEEKLVGRDQGDRLAAVPVAHEMATYRGKNRHAEAMFDH